MAICVIAPGGDVIVDIGDKHIRVSSSVLSLASPVFAAMFQSGFKEMITTNTSAKNPLNISLPEDDLQAFLHFCWIVHFKSEKITQPINAEVLNALGVLCDKYQCTASISFYVEVQFAKLVKTDSQTTFSKLLKTAYILDSPSPFKSISSAMLMAQTGCFKRDTVETPFSLDPHILLALNTRKTELHETIERITMRPIWHLAAAPCDEGHLATGRYTHRLHCAGLVPTASPTITKSFAQLVACWASFTAPNKGKCCYITGCVCSDWRFQEAWEEVKTQANEALRNLEGLCLDCVRSAGKSRVAATCRLGHPKTLKTVINGGT